MNPGFEVPPAVESPVALSPETPAVVPPEIPRGTFVNPSPYNETADLAAAQAANARVAADVAAYGPAPSSIEDVAKEAADRAAADAADAKVKADLMADADRANKALVLERQAIDVKLNSPSLVLSDRPALKARQDEITKLLSVAADDEVPGWPGVKAETPEEHDARRRAEMANGTP